MSDQTPTMLLLPVETRDALIRYLAQRPYAEVAEGVQTLQNLQPAPPSNGKAGI